MTIDYITFGIGYVGETPDVFCRIIRAREEDGAIAIAEGVGNVPGTTIAYTPEALVALCGERPDFIESDEEATIP